MWGGFAAIMALVIIKKAIRCDAVRGTVFLDTINRSGWLQEEIKVMRFREIKKNTTD